MLPQDVWLRTEWLSCRKNSVLRCVERYSAAAASEYRRALRKVQEVEETMAQVGTETGPHGTASQPAARLQSGEVEALNRRLSAANAEIRRYQTRLFACEREVVALRQENAELEALCDQARKNELPAAQDASAPGAGPARPAGDRVSRPGSAGTALPEAVPARVPPSRRRQSLHRLPRLPKHPNRKKWGNPPLHRRTGNPPPGWTIFRWTSCISWKLMG